ncbi:hypothetical protein Pyrfu_0625 [Pyrolobus fumarii 1A]|uniref:Uncharacterized protein n=1 Tax=Pyrolobus fumarii (strain DSM 11204 / 1A) TaxID=694429 RepID=G0EHB9_PYRF1|nr:hypothetical protein Pyrfu_0625 [Pyrolobus fumarii 1A]
MEDCLDGVLARLLIEEHDVETNAPCHVLAPPLILITLYPL